MNIVDRIKELAAKQGISISKVESDCGLTANSIYAWKTRTPGIDKIKAVADYFDVSVDFLIGRTSNSNATNENNQAKVDLSKTNIFSYRGDEMNVDGIDPDDWEIIKAVLARRQKREDGK